MTPSSLRCADVSSLNPLFGGADHEPSVEAGLMDSVEVLIPYLAGLIMNVDLGVKPANKLS